MKNVFAVLTLVVLFLSPFAEAQQVPIPEVSGPGRPDPTGRGRYLQYGTEVSYSGATVLKELPTGAKCAPAGELVGVPVWNSTRAGHAIASVLTDKAEIATSGTRTFLCWCIAGFNELFLPDVPTETLAKQPVTPPTETVNKIIREVRVIGEMDLRIIPPPPPAQQQQPKVEKESGWRPGKKTLIFATLAISVFVSYKNDWWRRRKPVVETGPAKLKCSATGYPNNCPGD
jgi:hypothetical protein